MKILRIVLFLLVILVVIVGVAALTLPAEMAYRWAGPYLGPVRLGGIAGTVWNGSATTVSVFNVPVGSASWEVERLPLLSRRVEAKLALGGGGIEAKGGVRRTADGRLFLHDATFHFPAALAAPAVDIPQLQLLGEIDGTLADAEVVGGWVAGARGTARWTHAGVSGAAEARFGDLLAEFASQPDGSVLGTVKDDGKSNLGVDGQFVAHGGQFDAQATLSVRNDDPQVREALRYVGQLQLDGTSLLKIHGQLFKWF